MKNLIALTIVFIAFSSCRKDEPITEEDNEIPLPSPVSVVYDTPGTYYIYEWYEIDSTGVESPYGITDSMYVVGEAMLNGKTYVHISGTYMGNTSNLYYRDSAGLIINDQGAIQWSIYQPFDTLSIDTVMLTQQAVTYTIYDPVTSFVLPTGIWHGDTIVGGSLTATYNRDVHYHYVDGSPFTPCDQVWVSKRVIVDGMGEIMSQTAFLGQLSSECKYLERRMTFYNIAE